MHESKSNRVLFAYFETPVREYARTLELIKASGGLSSREIDEIRAQVPAVHAETIIRHLRPGGLLDAERPQTAAVANGSRSGRA